jgi:predicted hotdog family 3-hydroxylacyl-ACP dehydratase
MANIPDILTLIPQRSPFVMVDALSYADEKGGKSHFRVRKDNLFLENDHLTEPAMIENIAQTAAARIGYICKKEGQEVPIGYIGAVQNLEILSLPKINELIETEITIKNQIFDVTVIAGTIRNNQIPIASCEMKIFISRGQKP